MVKGKLVLAAAVVAASFSIGAGTSQAVIYTEAPGDAGQTLTTAQATGTPASPTGTSLTMILGTFGTGADADLFEFTIANTTTFSATTNNTLTNSVSLDTALFLFDGTGHAIITNDDANGTTLASTIPAGNSLVTTLSAGTYFLGISGSGNEPVNSVNDLLFQGYPGGDTTALRGAVVSINPTTLATFNGNVSFSQTASYEIDLTGAGTFAPVPEPSTWAVVGASAAALAFLRRRRQA